MALCAVSEALRQIATRSYNTCGRCGAVFQINSLLRINRLVLDKFVSKISCHLVTPRGLLEHVPEKNLRNDCFRTSITITHNPENYGNNDSEEAKDSRMFLLYLVAGVVLCAGTNQGLFVFTATCVVLILFFLL